MSLEKTECMKAIVCSRYGSPDFLHFEEVPKPVPRAKQVLVKVVAATVTAGDCEIRRFNIPFLFWLPLRIILGITRPKPGIFGQEFAGQVEAIGEGVTRCKVGDAVFGPTTIRLGAHAQYISISEKYLTKFNSGKMEFKEAATIPTGGINGLHFVTKAQIKYGETVLIIGAGGSIGTYAIQIAKSHGAAITCIDSARKLEILRKLGADRVIDYEKTDFTKSGIKYDVIIDVVGKNSFSRITKCLKPHGRYVMGNPSFSGMLQGLGSSIFGDKKVIFEFADYKREVLIWLKTMIEEGSLKPVIDRSFPLEDVAAAHRYVEAGLKCGNVIIDVNQVHQTTIGGTELMTNRA
jgi:NADPH:quinone reductase-like Zn-dependent oxidoreductase